MTSTSLLELTRALATDDETKAEFRQDPDGFLAAKGHPDLDPAELVTALEHVADALPAPLAASLATAGEAAADLGDLLGAGAAVDPAQAAAAWEELTGGPSHGDPSNDTDPHDGLDGLDAATELGDDPADLDEPGGFDRADDDDANNEPGGFDRAKSTDEDTPFGRGNDAPDPISAPDDEPTVGAPRDPVPDSGSDWMPGDEALAGLLDPFGIGDAGDEPGGFDPVDDAN